MSITSNTILNQARSWLGLKESDGSFKIIIDTYNAYKPLARSYKVQYTDQWCDTFLSALFIKCNAVSLIGGTECGVEEHVKLFKAAGIWNEDGTVTPKPGWIIVYNWDDRTQPNDGYSDHIGIVESVSGNKITTIEGNYKDSVARRVLTIGHGQIRGYACPKYGEEEKPVEKPVASGGLQLATVKMGSTGESVVMLQNVLNCLRYGLETDGQFGFKTYAAVTSFQNTNNLTVDGIVGPATWKALKDAFEALQMMINEIADSFLSAAV